MFCLNYYSYKEYLNDVEQLKIHFNPTDKTLGDFLKKYKDKSIVIDITKVFNQIDAKILSQYSKQINNFKVILDYNNKEIFQLVQKYKIPFFFTNFATSIDQVRGLMKYNPTDIYICQDLGFKLNKVSKLLHDNNIKVRVFPNICQSSFSAETASIKTFFIRPEDIPTYQNYVDVFQIISDQSRQRVLYKIYKNHKWLGPLEEIIPTFKDYLDNRYLLKSFGQIRSRCGKRCMYDQNSCKVCERFQQLSNTFEAFHIMQQRPKIK